MQKEEHNIQQQCINYYRGNFPNGVIFAVPNAGKRSAAALNYLIQEGFCSGAPDLVVMRTDGKVIFVEMKTQKGRLSSSQVSFKERCDNLDDDLYFVCRSLEEFKNIVDNGDE